MYQSVEKIAFFLAICASNLHEIFSETTVHPPVDQQCENERSSLVFVFDTTGSMGDDLEQMREGAEMILRTALEKKDVIADFVFVPFNDPEFGPATVTQDKEVFKSAINITKVKGGEDCPEMSLSGIQLALNVSRPRSHLYVFTDASAKDYKLAGTVLESIQRQQSQVVFILTGHCNDTDKPSYKAYQQIAAASSGQIFNLNKTSVHKVLDFVRESIKCNVVNLQQTEHPPGYNHSHTIPVDSSISEIQVSVAGPKPQINVTNPQGQEVTGPPQVITIVDLPEIGGVGSSAPCVLESICYCAHLDAAKRLIQKVVQLEPGKWTIRTGSNGNYSVKVAGTSTLTFHHGFSVAPPGSMEETSYRPLKDTSNHLMIELTQKDRPLQMDYAEILSLDGKKLLEEPLTEVDPDKKTYVTAPFFPPDDFFYIAIKGRDEYDQEIRRIGNTAIKAMGPNVPYLTVPKKIEARIYERVVLRCKVESLVPVTVFWAKHSDRVQEKVSSVQSTTVDYVIDDLRDETSGEYRCIATNVAGTAEEHTTVVMLVDPPVLTIEPINKTVPIGDSIEVICAAESGSGLLKIELYHNGVKIDRKSALNYVEDSYLGWIRETLNNVTEKISGNYTCIAENKGGGESSISTIITVQSTNPIAQILGPHTISKPIHSTIQLVCRIEHADQVVWTSSRSGVAKVNANGSAVVMYDIVDVTEDGVWTCMAVKGDRNATDSVKITVLIKPEVSIEGDKNISIVNGSSHTLSCIIRAKPEPRILWHRETEDFLNNTITVLSPNVYKSVLTLDSSKEAVNGTYFCIGENSEGIGQDKVTITVRRPMTLVRGFSDMPVDLYSKVELHCQIDADPTPQIKWYHNATELRTTDNIRLSEDNSTLHVLRVDFKDLGLYLCKADNGFEKISVEGWLFADDLERPVLAKDPSQITTQKGNSTILPCRVIKGKPTPTLTWRYKKFYETYEPLPANVVLSGDNNLKILRVVPNNTGIYRCITENAAGSDFHDIRLKVQYPPVFLEDQKEIVKEVKEGERVKLSCEATGLPLPVVTWSKDNWPVSYSRNVYLSDENELIIREGNEYDAGLYTCNARNALGSIQRNTILVVYQPPFITPPDFEPALEVLEGELVELPCSAHGAPKPELVWLQNGVEVTEGRKYIDESGIRFVANLTDFGQYTCVTRNKYGSTSINYTISIWVPPYIDPPLKKTISTLLGSNVTLKCNATGFPVPTISWDFRGRILTENTADLSFNNIGDLHVINASSKHDGTYTCIAENFVGVAKKYLILNVNEPPKILEDGFSSYVATNKDTALTIPCKTTGKPKPFVAWVKDDRYYLDTDSRYDIGVDGSLTIKAPSEELSGLYTCVANNSVGRANRTVTVKIYPLRETMPQDVSETSVTVLEGTNASIKCPVQASDSDRVKWYKHAIMISEGRLQILNISRENASTYACVASNEVGSSYSKVNVNVEWPPRFTDDSWKVRIEVVKGNDWYFDCGADANPKAETKWLFNSKHMLREEKFRLKVMNIQFYHAGVYKCIASNIHGTVTRQFDLDVLVPPFISELDFLDVQLNEGSNATLECDAKGSPKPEIKWTFNNTNWHLENSTLTSTSLITASEGLFTCIATNKAGVARLVYRVQVVKTPKVEVVLYRGRGGGGESVEGKVQVAVGTHIRLSCVALGNPTPDIEWIRGGLTLAHNTEDVRYADITFDEVKSEDAGLYSCVAVNEGGIDARKVKLKVLEPPKIVQNLWDDYNYTKNVTYMEVESGQPFYLHCHPSGNPSPSLYWFRDGQPLRFYDDTMVSTDYGEVLVVKSADVGQSGNYTCVAKNCVGEASIAYLVDVLVAPPTPKDSALKVTTRASRPLNLTCPVRGRPPPTVAWIKHPYTELGGGRVVLSNNNYNLYINSSEVEDSGKYSCIMTNKAGTTEVSFNVIVEQPPFIIGKVAETVVVPLGRSFVLKCQARGNPTPKTAWLKDSIELTDNIFAFPNGSAMAIGRAHSLHFGQYTCVARNDAGTARARYDVILQVPGKWSSWSHWSLCNVTCGMGYQARARTCQYVNEYNVSYNKSTDRLILDKSTCRGPHNEKRKCHLPPCAEEETHGWSPWSKWSKCSATCGYGIQLRTRICRSKGPCVGDDVELRKCPYLPSCSRYSIFESGVYDRDGDGLNVTSPYIPEAVFEIHPDIMNSSDVEEVDIKPDSPPTSEHDVIVTENLDGSDRGPCKPGFKLNNTTKQCEDTDECLFEKNQCHSTQLCVNTLGGYRCACAPGFTSLGAGQRCLDINECSQGTHGCEYACVNVAGGYVCACAPRMRLAPDKHTCVTPSSSFKIPEDVDNLND